MFFVPKFKLRLNPWSHQQDVHGSQDAMAETASARGASTQVVAEMALAAAEASGVPLNQVAVGRFSEWFLG